MKNFIRVVKYIKKYKRYAFLNVFFNIISVVFSLFSLSMVAPFLGLLFEKVNLVTTKPPLNLNPSDILNQINYYVSQIIIEDGKSTALVFVCVLVLILFLIKNLFRYLALYFIAPIYHNIVSDIRNELYRKIMELPLSYYTDQRKGDIISRATNDVEEIKWTITSSLEVVFKEPLTILIFLLTLTALSPRMTVFVLIFLPLTGWLIGRVGKILKNVSAKGQIQAGLLMSILEETISGLRIVKAFNAYTHMENKFHNNNKRYTRSMINISRKRDLSAPMSEFLGTIVMVILIWFGGNLVLDHENQLSAEVFIMYIVVFSQIIPPAKSFTTALYQIQKGIASADRIFNILDSEITIKNCENPVSINHFENSIEFRNVSFAYEKENVLNKINLKIEKGKSIALVGQSGSGKSTLVDLLPRFQDILEGEIFIDGKSIKTLEIDSLRNLMGVVTQESILFNDTVLNNIAYASNSKNLDDVIAAAKVANAHDFIMEMEQGYYTYIGDRGSKLSGGQRQRISIARAVLKNPPILLLDEATSALDNESERLVQEALYNLMKNRTSIIIAHRLSTIQFADKIYVLQKGELVESGTHQELISLNGYYKRYHDLQSGLL